MMASALLLVISLVWIPNVMSLTPAQLQRVTDYIKDTVTGRSLNFQHAYVVKFTEKECQSLSDEDIKYALSGEDQARIKATVKQNGDIYTGPRMVMASFKESHSESRLFYSEDDETYPIDDLLNSGDEAGCVVFYSLYSPCIDKCLNPNSPFSIFNNIDSFKKINKKDIAFVFRNMFSGDRNKNERDIKYFWKKLNDYIPLYRCKQDCKQCFPKPNELNKDCLDPKIPPDWKPDDSQPSTGKRTMPDDRQPSTDKKWKPDSLQPSTSHSRRPDSPQPSSSDRRKPDTYQPSTSDRRKPDVHQPSTSDRRKPDIYRPSSSDRRKHDVHQPSTSDRRKPDVHQPSAGDRRKPDSPQPSSSNRRKDERRWFP